ncbi:uroporphyrinogen decarboxylase [Haloechinothrix sp. LS1_15]|uniref:uroporphyrinogen decarboxylase n=1 Tax=Haloechinothrix sp. LS1_15 TaxID=2652248 RepID=UPI00294822D4|nr:uroporphyrinogen decarboxylase [Haloechinothrix sp. LS1_15]MDV6013366.1 uroporphyrinogen decarboxylase [Haloechinothrix sp. LS1_15]
MASSIDPAPARSSAHSEQLGGQARRDLADAPLLAAARGATPSRLPVWFMRQAGRSLPEYRSLRQGVSMLNACFDPALLTEITLQPVRRHGVDAAILFSDIVVPLRAAGVEVEIASGVGPVVSTPVRAAGDVEALPELHAEQVAPVADGVRMLVSELGEVPLIGFAGAPFTLASYLIEGGPSKNHERTKALMHAEPELWHRLMSKLAAMAVTFLRAQLAAGADAVQLFDSWAGALSERDYREFVLPHSTAVLDGIADAGVPRIHFGVGTGELLPAMRQAGADVVGVDWRVPLDEAARRMSRDAAGPPAVQGNLDPALLLASWEVLDRQVRRIADEGRAAAGHVFNLGHGVLPETDADVLTRIVDLVHELRP